MLLFLKLPFQKQACRCWDITVICSALSYSASCSRVGYRSKRCNKTYLLLLKTCCFTLPQIVSLFSVYSIKCGDTTVRKAQACYPRKLDYKQRISLLAVPLSMQAYSHCPLCTMKLVLTLQSMGRPGPTSNTAMSVFT